MNSVNSKRSGRLMVSNDVLLKIAETAATDVPGVHGVSGRKVNLGLFTLSNYSKAVEIKSFNGALTVNICICVEENANIPTVCDAVQTGVKSSIQNMTGKAVSKVNVIVDDIFYNDEVEEETEDSVEE